MYDYGISAASVALSGEKLAQSVGIAVMNKAMDMVSDQALDILDAVEEAAPAPQQLPPSNNILDVRV